MHHSGANNMNSTPPLLFLSLVNVPLTANMLDWIFEELPNLHLIVILISFYSLPLWMPEKKIETS